MLVPPKSIVTSKTILSVMHSGVTLGGERSLRVTRKRSKTACACFNIQNFPITTTHKGSTLPMGSVTVGIFMPLLGKLCQAKCRYISWLWDLWTSIPVLHGKQDVCCGLIQQATLYILKIVGGVANTTASNLVPSLQNSSSVGDIQMLHHFPSTLHLLQTWLASWLLQRFSYFSFMFFKGT